MLEEYQLTREDYRYKRQEIVTLVNDSSSLRAIERRMKTTEVDRYRDAGLIPSRLYAAKVQKNRPGYTYSRETVEWIILGRMIVFRSRVEVPTTGRIFKQAIAIKGANQNTLLTLQALYVQDENYPKFLRRLLTWGILLPTDIGEYAVPEGED